jgi:hypothetical protein
VAEVKAEMQRELLGAEGSADAITITLTAVEFHASLVDDHELNLGGHWYDIISTKKSSDGRISIKCFADEKESLLRAWMDHASDNHDAGSAKGSKRVKVSGASDYLAGEIGPLLIIAPGIPESPLADNSSRECFGHITLPEIPPRA